MAETEFAWGMIAVIFLLPTLGAFFGGLLAGWVNRRYINKILRSIGRMPKSKRREERD